VRQERLLQHVLQPEFALSQSFKLFVELAALPAAASLLNRPFLFLCGLLLLPICVLQADRPFPRVEAGVDIESLHGVLVLVPSVLVPLQLLAWQLPRGQGRRIAPVLLVPG